MSELTARQAYILTLVDQIQEADDAAEQAKAPYVKARAEADRLKRLYEERLDEVRELQDELRKAKADRPYQPSLFDRQNAPASPLKSRAPAKSSPIADLGMTEKETELLEEAGIKTVEELEKRMRENALWHREVKGFGQAKIDKLSDKLVEFRRKHPVPDPNELPASPPAASPKSSLPEGAFDKSVEVQIAIPKKYKAHASIRVVETAPGEWYASFSSGGDIAKHGHRSEPLSGDFLQAYPSRKLALEAAAERLVDWWNSHKKDAQAKEIAKIIFDWRNTIEDGPAAAAAGDDRRLDADGNFVDGFEGIVIRTGDKAASLMIRVIQFDGRWFGGWIVGIDGVDQVQPVSRKSPNFGTREACVIFCAELLAKHLISEHAPEGADQYVACVVDFKKKINEKT